MQYKPTHLKSHLHTKVRVSKAKPFSTWMELFGLWSIYCTKTDDTIFDLKIILRFAKRFVIEIGYCNILFNSEAIKLKNDVFSINNGLFQITWCYWQWQLFIKQRNITQYPCYISTMLNQSRLGMAISWKISLLGI